MYMNAAVATAILAFSGPALAFWEDADSSMLRARDAYTELKPDAFNLYRREANADAEAYEEMMQLYQRDAMAQQNNQQQSSLDSLVSQSETAKDDATKAVADSKTSQNQVAAEAKKYADMMAAAKQQELIAQKKQAAAQDSSNNLSKAAQDLVNKEIAAAQTKFRNAKQSKNKVLADPKARAKLSKQDQAQLQKKKAEVKKLNKDIEAQKKNKQKNGHKTPEEKAKQSCKQVPKADQPTCVSYLKTFITKAMGVCKDTMGKVHHHDCVKTALSPSRTHCEQKKGSDEKMCKLLSKSANTLAV